MQGRAWFDAQPRKPEGWFTKHSWDQEHSLAKNNIFRNTHSHKSWAENSCAATRALQFGHQMQRRTFLNISQWSHINNLPRELKQVVKSYHNPTKIQGRCSVVLFSSPTTKAASVQQQPVSPSRLIPVAMCSQQCLCNSSSFTDFALINA